MAYRAKGSAKRISYEPIKKGLVKKPVVSLWKYPVGFLANGVVNEPAKKTKDSLLTADR